MNDIAKQCDKVGWIIGLLDQRHLQCTENSCTNGWRTTLKVPSRNHVCARARSRSWSGVAKRRCLPSSTCTSVCRKSDPMNSTSRSKSRDVGSVGWSFSRLRFVARLRFSMCGRLAGGASAVASVSCARTLSITAPADAKMSSVAFSYTCDNDNVRSDITRLFWPLWCLGLVHILPHK